MIEDYIRYNQLIDTAMREVVKKALQKVKADGLAGEHHFLISFITSYEGVDISPRLKEKYPEEMTIVIQHQYEDLKVTEQDFSVVLSFDGKREKITIPFAALTSFADPGVKFGLKFNILIDEDLLEELEGLSEETVGKLEELDTELKEQEKKSPKKKPAKSKKKEKPGENVVDLSHFRKKK